MRLRKHGFVPDIIYAHFAFASGAIASRLSMAIGVNYVLSLGESTLEQTLQNEGPIRTPILDAMHGAAAIACVSRGLLAAASRFVPGANSYYVPNGVDLDIFSKQPRDQARAKLGIRTKEPVFGFVGSLTERKGAPVLKFLSDQLGEKFNLMVATGGQQIDLPTLRCGFVPNRELATFLSACDFFLFPTVAEGMSNALLEAMACEVPIITSDTAFNREFLNHENAILTDFSDREGLMRIVESAIANPLQFEPLAQKAVQDVKHYSLEKRVDRIERILMEQRKPL
jgi:glycosyltransferase involved in cell wall biosynthesis